MSSGIYLTSTDTNSSFFGMVVFKTIKFSDEEFQDLTEKVGVYKGKVPWPKVTAAYNSAHPENTRTLYQCQHAW